MFKSQLRDILRQSPSRQYGKKKYLWRAGDKCSGLWLIKFGAVKTFYLNANGDEQITGFYLPGEYIGVDELSGECHRGYAQVTDDCAVHHLSSTQLSEFMDTRDERRYIYRMMSEHLRLNKTRFRQLSRASAGERLAGFIYDIPLWFSGMRSAGFSVTDAAVRYCELYRRDAGNGGRFVCNDGSLSQSKRFCSGYGSSATSNPVKQSTPTRKAKTKKVTTAKKQEPQRVADNDEPVSTQPRQPTCAPLYMASKPGYTHLPICSGNQY